MTTDPGLVEGALGGDGYDPNAGPTFDLGGGGGYEGPSFDPSWSRWQTRALKRELNPALKSWIRQGAPASPGAWNDSIKSAGRRYERSQQMAERIVADRDAFLQAAVRADKIGKAYPWMPADVAYALSAGGYDDLSEATTRAAEVTGITSPVAAAQGTPTTERTTTLTARAAVQFAKINAEMGDSELFQALVKRGWDPNAVDTFTFDPNVGFRTLTDANVTAGLRQVLDAEAATEDVDDGGSWLADAAGGVFGVAKGTSRWATSFLWAPWQAYNGAVRENLADYSNDGGLSNADKIMAVAGAYIGLGWDKGWDDTDFAEAVREGVGPGGINAGTGWFMGGGVSATKTAKDYYYYANQVGEEPGTMGRALTSVVFKPGSIPFRVGSGIVDAAGSIATDPSSYVPAGWVGKVARATPGIKGFTSALDVIKWSGSDVTVTLARDSLRRTVDDALSDAKVPVDRDFEVRFPNPDDMPMAADGAGRLDSWAPRWYSGGSPSQSGVAAILTGGDEIAGGVRLRSFRKPNEPEPVRLELDATGLTGHADTTADTGWASEIARNRSSQIVPNATASELRSRVTKIDVTEQLDLTHPVAQALQRLVTEDGWNVVHRTIPVRNATGEVTETRQVTTLLRPDQALPEGTRVSPFVERVDETTGEIGSVLSPSATTLDNPLGNWSASATADLSPGTFLTLFGEVKVTDTKQLFDRTPIQGVTDPDMLTEIPDADSFRVMLLTDDLKGGVDDIGGGIEKVTAQYEPVPDAAWGRPPQPKPFDEAKAHAEATQMFDRELAKHRPETERNALEMLDEMEGAAGEGGFPGLVEGLSKGDRTRALTTGEVPLEALLNATDPSSAQNLARYLTHGPIPEDRVQGVRAESTASFSENIISDYLHMNLPPERAEKILKDWKAGKRVTVRVTKKYRTVATPDGPKRKAEGGRRVYVTIPGINTLEAASEETARRIGDVDEVIDYLRGEHAAKQAAWDETTDGPTLYVGEKADVTVPVGKAEASYPEHRVFPTARTATTKADNIDGVVGLRAVGAKWKKRRAPKVADLGDETTAREVIDVLTDQYEKVVDRVAESQIPEDLIGAMTRLEQALTEGDAVTALREYEKMSMLLPESQGQNAARAALAMDQVADTLRASGYDVVKWSDGGEDVFEILHTADWRWKKPARAKTGETVSKVSDDWDGSRFGVKLSGTQDELYHHVAQMDVPTVRPKNMPIEQWETWLEQRERLLARGWSADTTELGREVLRRPLAGEYDAQVGETLHRVLDEGDATSAAQKEAGVNLNGTRDVLVPEQFYDHITTDKRYAKLWDKIAATDSIEDIMRLIGNHQPPAFLAALARAKDAEHVLETVIEFAGLREIRALKIRGASTEAVRGAVDSALYHLPGFKRGLDDIRMLHVMPGQYVDLADPEDAFRKLHDWLINARVDKTTREALLMQMADNLSAFGRKETFFAAFDAIEEAVKAGLRRSWAKYDDAEIDRIAREMTRLFKDEWSGHAKYAMKARGEGTVAGTQTVQQDFVVQSPEMLADFFDGTLPLPNPREIARVTGAIGRIAGTGTLRGKSLDRVIRGLDGYNSFWKVTALARLAYPVRIMLEEQGRMYAAGFPNIFTHPIQYIMHTYIGRKGTDGMGNKWDDLLADSEPNAYANSQVNASLLFEQDNSVKFVGRSFDVVDPADDRYLQGWMFGIGKYASDPVAKRIAGGFTKAEREAMPAAVAGGSRSEQVTWWLTNTEKGKGYLMALLEATRESMPDLHQSLQRLEGVQRWVDLIDERVTYITAQNDPELLKAIATGRLTAGDNTQPIWVSTERTRGAQVYNTSTPNSGGFIDVLRNYTRLDAKPPEVVVPNRMLAKGELPWRDRAVTAMFAYLNGKPTNYLTRSPVFREKYWETYAEHVRYATDKAADKIRARLDDMKLTRQQRRDVERALDNRVADENRTLTDHDIDDLAKADALDTVQDLLYDTADKTHFWDAMRIVAPFGNAWAEVLSTWARLAVNNPKILDRLAMGVHGAQQPGSNVIYDATGTIHDPEQGFFYKNPQTGDESFSWPMPPQAQALVAAMFPAPVAGMNLIGQVQPGFGPVVTAAAGPLLNHPGWREDVYNFIAPFGGPSADEAGGFGNAVVDSVTPAWLRKLLTAVYPVTAEQKSQLAAAELSSQTYLASTGRYDMGDPEDMTRLQSDAHTMAQRLFFLRGIMQFVLPTMGGPEQVAKTGNGELVLQTKMAAILRDYQQDPGEGGYGYQQGFLRFLRDYGSELYLLGVDRTESTGFMAPTRPTFDWMRQHPGLTKKYPDVWGLLVDDPGSEFYYPAYQAQIREGFRTLIAPEDLIGLANERLGRALYTSYRAQYPESLSEDESVELQRLQDRLELQFPGYSRVPSSLGSYTKNIDQMGRAALDPEVQALPVGKSLATYFAARSSLKSQGISSFRTGDGRELAPQLWSLGETLAAQDPTFAYAWDRLLSTEFDTTQFMGEDAAA